MKNILLLLIFVSLISCKQKPEIKLRSIPDEGLYLTKWQVLGPFTSNGKNNFFEEDNLKQFGLSETNLSYKDFINVTSKSDETILNKLVNVESFIDFNQIFSFSAETSITGNAYAMCLIKCNKSRKLKLNHSSDDLSKIWINNNLVYDFDKRGGLTYYENYFDVQLNKGINQILVKVGNFGLDWRVFLRLEENNENGHNKFVKSFEVSYNSNFLDRSMILQDTLKLSKNLPSGKYSISVCNQKNKSIVYPVPLIKEKNWNISTLKDGLYQVKLTNKDVILTQLLYKGNILDTLKYIKKNINKFLLNIKEKQIFEALNFRINHLLKPENIGKNYDEKQNWDRKIIPIYEQLDHLLTCLKIKKDPFYDVTGDYLRSYISPIDSGIQYYQIHVPSKYNKNIACPIFIQLPAITKRYNSYLETQRMADVFLFNLLQFLSNKYNIIILRPHGRTLIGNINSNSIDETDIWEALEDVKKNYNIDSSRIYLNGVCESGEMALRLAVKNPHKFAALTLIAPSLKLQRPDNIWFEKNNPLNYLKNITNIPVLDIHSKFDFHTSFQQSKILQHLAKEANMQKFVLKEETVVQKYYNSLFMEDAITYSNKFSINPRPTHIYFTTGQLKHNTSYWITLNEINTFKNAIIDANISNNTLIINKQEVISYSIDLTSFPYNKNKPLKIIDNGKVIFEGITNTNSLIFKPSPREVIQKTSKIEGPLADIFTKPFILVPGTTGTPEENIKLKSLMDTIKSNWKLKYYHECRSKLDKYITNKDIIESNLVLIGGSKSNIIIKNLINKLPISVTDTSVKIINYLSKGRNLNFYVIFPNPLNPQKYIGIISYNNPKYISLGDEENGIFDVSNYGWFDYKIWSYDDADNIKLSGYFNNHWQ